MALSMDEQRVLAEIERRLAAEDPGLATCLTAFRRPGPATVLRSPRARIIGSLFTVLLVALVSLMVYAMIPFRGHGPRNTGPDTSASSPSLTTSVPAQGQGPADPVGPSSGTAIRAGGSAAPVTHPASATGGQAATGKAAGQSASSAAGPLPGTAAGPLPGLPARGGPARLTIPARAGPGSAPGLPASASGAGTHR